MKYFDLAIQTLILLFAGVAFAVSGPKLSFLDLMAVQFIFGAWQMLSSFISVLTQAPLFKYKCIHLVAALVYLGLLVISAVYHWWPDFSLQARIFVTLPAWTLGLLYYLLTWKWALLSHKQSSSFLPHINF
jgi:hypothetical protein